MSQLLVCTMYLPELAVSGSLTVDCPQLPEHADGIVLSLKTVNEVGALLWIGLVCGPFSGATSAAVACGPIGAFGSELSSFMSRARAARCAAVGTNGLLLVAAWITAPPAMWPVRAAAVRTPAGTVLAALPGTVANSPESISGTAATAINANHRRLARIGRIPMEDFLSDGLQARHFQMPLRCRSVNWQASPPRHKVPADKAHGTSRPGPWNPPNQ